MFENLLNKIKSNPIKSTATALTAGIILGVAAPSIIKKDSNTTEATAKQESAISGVETQKIRVEPGKTVTLDALSMVKSYRINSIKSGEEGVAVYGCTVTGSDAGDIDLKNRIVDFSSDTELLKNINISIPNVGGGYDGKYGYGYFVVCGEKVKDGEYKLDFAKRVIYQTLPDSQHVDDKKTSFKLVY